MRATPIIAALLLSACGPKQAENPTNALRKYVAAIRANQPAAAYELLDQKTKKVLSKTEFVNRWKARKVELGRQAKDLEVALEKPPLITAKLTSTSGEQTRLTFKKSRWWIETGLHLAANRTPKEAVESLLEAAQRRDYLAVKRLMTSRVARAFEQEIEKRIKKVKAAAKRGIKVRGNRAYLRTEDYRLELIREGGQWKIYDFD
jgi:hypothetical protein